jgi:HAD superfamily hydrolase (TIGR01509 family)
MTPMTEATAWDAVLWDLDGTLVDSEGYWRAAEFALADRHGGSWTNQHAMNVVGSNLMDSAVYIREHMGIDVEPSVIVQEMVDDVLARLHDHVPWRPGARELLLSLADDGVPLGLVTMSYQPLVVPVLAGLPRDIFGVIVTGDCVTQGKPHPEAYLTAIEALGVRAHRCLAIEDSEPGTRSAERAGCAVLVVPHQVPVAAGPRRHRITSLLTTDVRALANLGSAFG